ncbi:MAG: hypothetical protein NTV86_20110 [Planctomycetota bacterium]|nr:hypothetical protein [Planctomycetota bacterium]
MTDIRSRIRTPHKHNALVLEPSWQPGEFDSHFVDCPFLFSDAGRYYMTFVGYDTIGYRTGLAGSSDLVHWTKEGLILDRGPAGSVTQYNAALTCILRDNALYGPGQARKIDGRYVGAYHAYPNPGCENGPAVIGLCFSEDLRHWTVGEPVLRPGPVGAWDGGGLYKAWILEHAGVFYLFYNAKDRDEGGWREQTGLATSKDLVHWTRHGDRPLIPNGPAGSIDEIFASDPCVLHDGADWVMFYYTLDAQCVTRETAAISRDLLTWTKIDEVLIDVGPVGHIDSRYAHKPGVIAHAGRLHHFYTAVAPCPDGKVGAIETGEIRGISFARS